jgi:CRISPR/Cas system-associated endonuclease Cas1
MSEQDWNTVVFTNKNKISDKNKQVVITNQEKELLEEDGNVPKIKVLVVAVKYSISSPFSLHFSK